MQTVVAVVSDMGGNFVAAANQLGVTAEKPYFFVNGKKIFYLNDVPHLIKAVRNNLITHDYVRGDERVCWGYLLKMQEINKSRNFAFASRVTDAHVKFNNKTKMRVKYAAQLFSNSVYAALMSLMNPSIAAGKDLLPPQAKYTAEFVKKMNDLFDLLNASIKARAYRGTPEQDQLLEDCYLYFSTVTAMRKKFDRDGNITFEDNTSHVTFLSKFCITIRAVQ